MALRFQRRQPGNLEVRGISRQRVSSPESALDLFESGHINSVIVQSSNVSYAGPRRQVESSYGNPHDVIIPSSLDLPPPIITPPLASPSSDSELEARAHDWTTGAMTERSSVSWMDEFDKQTTKTVERMFREIDYALYESRESSQSHLLSTSEALGQECEDWSSRFPHMRVVGQLLATPNSSSTKHRDRQASTPILMGFQERAPRSSSSDEEFSDNNDSEAETIFAIDGKGAEATKTVTAISSQDESKRTQISLPSTLHSTRSRMAPSLATGTPILRTREDLIRQLTWEAIWPVVARCIRPLLLALKADKVHSMYSTPAPDAVKQVSGGMMGQTSSITTSRLAQSRPAAGTFFTSTTSGPRNLSGQIVASAAVAANNNGPAETQRILGSLLLISSKQINNRRQDAIEAIGSVPPVQFQLVQPLQQPPVPAVALIAQPVNRATTSQQQRPTSGMRVPSASTRGRLGRGRLHPMERPKTPSTTQQDDYIFDGLRGQKLHTAAELRPQQSTFSGGLPMPKNSPLPPLHHSYGGISGVGPLPNVGSTAQSTGDFLSVAPVVGSAALVRTGGQRAYGVPTTSRAPSAAVTHERPPPTFRMASDVFLGSGLTNGISGRPVVGVSQSNNNNSLYVLNRSNTLLNVTGVGVIGPMDEFDRLAAASNSTARAPATAIGMARASLVTSSYAAGGPSHGAGR